MLRKGKNMKKTVLSALLIIGLSIGTISSAVAEQKIAVIDTVAVAAKSTQVQNLKKEQQTKMLELEKWLVTAKTDIEKQQTKEGKEKLIKKYDAEFAKKQQALLKDYQTKLQAVDKSITDTITKYAQANGYSAIFTKGVVLYGGDDITENIIKIVK